VSANSTPLDAEIARDLWRMRVYVSVIREACSARGVDPYDLAALGCRETGWGYGRGYAPVGDPFGHGDGGHGYGLLQLDDRSQMPRIARVEAVRKTQGPAAALRLMLDESLAVLLDEKRSYLTSPKRDHGPLAGDLLRRATFAAYNAGAGRVYQYAVAGMDVDQITTGHDYSKWVVAKVDALRAAAPTLFAIPGGACV
jgi:hypothetical protein